MNTAKIQQKSKQKQIINDLVSTAIDCVIENSLHHFDCKEEETIYGEADFIHNGDIIGYIQYEVYNRCTYKGNRYTAYNEPPDNDEYSFFYEKIQVEILRPNCDVLTNLSQAVNQKLQNNKYKLLD